VNNAALISSAMTDYLLVNGTNKAPAAQAPAHMAAWLEAKGYCIVRSPGADPGDFDLVARIAALIDWQSAADEDGRREIVREVLATSSATSAVPTDVRRVA
jgi:hypothetical protein